MKNRSYNLWPEFLAFILIFCFISPALESQEKFRRLPPYPEPLSPLLLPPVESEVLGNGLKLLVVARNNNHLFNLQVVIQAGESDSPAELPGLATTTARLMLRGTTTAGANEVEERLAFLGIEYSIEVQADYTIFSFSFLDENLEPALALISLFFVEPSFPSLELAAVKRELYYQLLRRNQDPENAAYDFFLKKIFAGSGYNPGALEAEAIKNISVREVNQFHQRFLRPNNSIIIFNGQVSLTEARRLVVQHFRRWVPRPVERPPVQKLENRDFDQVCFLDVPGPEVAVVAGNLTVPISSPDYYSLLVLNHLLGGTTGSRLFLQLRELKGLAFYAFSELSFFQGNGLYWVRTKTSPPALGQALTAISRTMRSLYDERIEPEELERAKAYLMGNLPIQLQSPEALSKRIGLLELFQLPPDFWAKYPQNIMLLNAESVQLTARRYLSTRPLVVIAAEAATTLDYLKEFDKIDVYNRKGQFQGVLQKGVMKYENR
ncbi:MAG: insulinase family protein [Candidatus Saccharicenans sp.]|nr:insulinase family protein [Candidatus Saccharicenans sp.]